MNGSMKCALGSGCRLLAVVVTALAAASMVSADEGKGAVDTFESGKKKIHVEHFEAKKTGKVPAIIIVHGADGPESHGDAYRDYAHQLTDAGYAVFIVHYFDRTDTTKEPNEQQIRASFLSWMQTLKDGITYASKQPNVDDKKIGLLGFSLGSFLALSTATQEPRVGAIVEYFGGLPGIFAPRVQKMPPTLILHGEDDKSIPVKEAHSLEKIYKDKQLPYEIKLYAGQGHGFTGDDAKDATKRAIAFFDKHLK
jgi:carboxymethylenebutenolidase